MQINNKTYSGTCYPKWLQEYSNAICEINFSGETGDFGNVRIIYFRILYQTCSSSSINSCYYNFFNATGYAVVSQSKNLPYFSINLTSNINSTLVINQNRYFSNQTIYMPLGKYSIYTISPNGYNFKLYKSNNFITIYNPTSINTTFVLTGNASIEAIFNASK